MKKIFYTILAIAVLVFGGTTIAMADNNKNNKDEDRSHEKAVKLLGSTLEVHITDNGNVLARGSKVTSISGTTITATNIWGGVTMNWAINTDSNTKFIQKNGKSTGFSDIQVNDIISFQGPLVTTVASPMTVQAKVVKDWSKINNPESPKPFTREGTLKSISGTTVPTTFVFTSGNIDYTVNVATNTSILSNNWLTTPLSGFVVGNKVRVYGLYNSDNTVNATVIRNTSL